MANVAISGLPVTTTMTDTDVLPVVATGVTSQISGADLKTYIGSGATPAGANTQIQFNDAGAFGADANLVYDNTTQTLTITGSVQATSIGATESVFSNVSVSQCYVELANFVTTNQIDVTQGNFFAIEVTGPITLDVINYAVGPGPFVVSFVLEIKDGGTNVTWWPGITWPGGVAPTLSTVGTDVLAFYYVMTGDWRGFTLGLDMKV